jgi:hypothetical protein
MTHHFKVIVLPRGITPGSRNHPLLHKINQGWSISTKAYLNAQRKQENLPTKLKDHLDHFIQTQHHKTDQVIAVFTVRRVE